MTDHISPLISVSQLYDLLKNAPEKLRLFDVTVNLPSPRFDGDYRLSDDAKGWQSKHIPQARYCNILDEKIADHSAPYSFAPTDNQTLIKGLEEIGVDSNASIVLYDRGSGFWAARLWWVLKSIGVEAKVLDGGFSAWVQAGYPIESGNIENFSKGHIIYDIQKNMWSSLAEVKNIVENNSNNLLICALSEDVFKGKSPTRYTRRGHIPKSICIPARSMHDSQGRFLPVSELKKKIDPLFKKNRSIVLYCGGGISAASLALAFAICGRDVSIYDGSLQEWTAQLHLPIVTEDI